MLIRGGGGGGGWRGWGDQNFRTDFDNPVIRPVFHMNGTFSMFVDIIKF